MATAPSSPIRLAAAAGPIVGQTIKVMQPFHRKGSHLGMVRGARAALKMPRVLRAVLKTHVPSGFCFGSRAAPMATAPSSPIRFPAAQQVGRRGHQAIVVLEFFHRHRSPLKMLRAARAVQLRLRVLRAVLKTHVPSGFCFGSRAAPRAAVPASPILLTAEAGSAPRGRQAIKVLKFSHMRGSPLGMIGGAGAALQRFRLLRAVLKTHFPSGFCFGSRAAPRATGSLVPDIIVCSSQ